MGGVRGVLMIAAVVLLVLAVIHLSLWYLILSGICFLAGKMV